MPAPGHQYQSENIKNPFDERTVNAFTAREIATLQSRLNRQLGPEYISHRQGAGGGKVAYLEGTKAIALANDVFGFNGWSSSLQQVQIDYVDEGQNGRISLGLSIIVRVTLKDGTYHEDIGYGVCENMKGKGAAFEKAKKEAATDGLKRALRSFGNVLGNCLYDKEYLKKVSNMKVRPIKFDEDRLHRHPDFAPPPPAKEDWELAKGEEHKTPRKPNPITRTDTEYSMVSVGTEVEDEFGGNLFDGVEISEHHSDEFSFDTVPGIDTSTPKLSEGPKIANTAEGAPPARTGPGPINGPKQPPMGRVQSMPAMRPPNVTRQPAQQPQQNQGPPKQGPSTNQRAPQTPNYQQHNARPDVQRPRMPPPTVDIHAPPKAPAQPVQQQNQPTRTTPQQDQQQHQGLNNQAAPPKPLGQGQQPPANCPPVGFVTSRAADMMQNLDSTASLTNLPIFNPHAESPIPKEKRTPGIDHTRSVKITREAVGAPPPPPLPDQPNQPQQKPPQQAQAQAQAQGNAFRPVGRPGGGSNFVNPHQDVNRRIGMPAAHAMSPLANRNAYKPPGMAGGIKRPPLADVSNQGGRGESEGPPEAKKPRLEASGVENAGGMVAPS